MSDRLSKSDWLGQGLRTLAQEGPGGLKAGPMAAALKVSRGSFYWHFADIADFRAQLLTAWRERTVDRVIQALDTKAGPDRLKYLMRRAFGVRLTLERAVRAWALEDPDAARVVAEVDAGRTAHIAGLLEAAGVAQAKAGARAAFIYWAYLGHALADDDAAPGGVALGGAALDEIADLFER